MTRLLTWNFPQAFRFSDPLFLSSYIQIVSELLDVSKYPGKPVYEMAPPDPLVLFDCGYSQSDIRMRTAPILFPISSSVCLSVCLPLRHTHSLGHSFNFFLLSSSIVPLLPSQEQLENSETLLLSTLLPLVSILFLVIYVFSCQSHRLGMFGAGKK